MNRDIPNQVHTDIKRTLWGAFGYVYEYRKPFAKALFFPVSILVALGALSIQEPNSVLMVVLVILPWVIYTILAITIHRIILLGPNSVSEWGVYTPGKREAYFILHSIGLSLFMIPFGFISVIPAIGWIVSMIAIIYMMARLSLVFPAIATDQSWAFSDSWKATKNHQALMMVVVAIFPFVISIPERLLSKVPYAGGFVNLLSALTLVFVVSALSVAFKLIAESSEGT
ncbi:MAG: hypothetical protein AB2689_23440 [Candidatus Thiodiazotropha taylori]|nr:hypothetical protein [Candidatus Thiodiazotropha taylori]